MAVPSSAPPMAAKRSSERQRPGSSSGAGRVRSRMSSGIRISSSPLSCPVLTRDSLDSTDVKTREGGPEAPSSRHDDPYRGFTIVRGGSAGSAREDAPAPRAGASRWAASALADQEPEARVVALVVLPDLAEGVGVDRARRLTGVAVEAHPVVRAARDAAGHPDRLVPGRVIPHVERVVNVDVRPVQDLGIRVVTQERASPAVAHL